MRVSAPKSRMPSAGKIDKTQVTKRRALIADDHALMRDLVSAMLGNSDGWEVVGQVSTAAEAIAACQELSPDLLVLDVNMPGRSGIDAVADIKKASPHTRVLVCCSTVNEQELLAAMHHGVDGFMEKTNSGAVFLEAISRVVAGENYLCAKSLQLLASALQKNSGSDGADGLHALTPREKEIIRLIAGGFSSKEIANKLFLSAATVDTHRANLMAKIHARNVAQVIHYAMEHGLAPSEKKS